MCLDPPDMDKLDVHEPNSIKKQSKAIHLAFFWRWPNLSVRESQHPAIGCQSLTRNAEEYVGPGIGETDRSFYLPWPRLDTAEAGFLDTLDTYLTS